MSIIALLAKQRQGGNMVGNVIYLIVCRRNSGMGIETDIETVHATFDGVFKRIELLKKLWTEKGYEVVPHIAGGFDVYTPQGYWNRTLTVRTKTINE